MVSETEVRGLPLVVIVTGLSATGKTALSQSLSHRFGLPLFSKDAFKEAMYEAYRPDGDYERMDRDLLAMMGRASVVSLTVTMEATIAAGGSAIFESNFDRHLFSPTLEQLFERYPFFTIQAHLTADGEVLAARFEERERRGGRHPGHQGLRDMERVRRALLNGPDEPLDLPRGRTLSFDTTDFANTDFSPLFEAIEEHLRAFGHALPNMNSFSGMLRVPLRPDDEYAA